MTTPLDSPEMFDLIFLDGTRSPGLCIRTGGGERKQKWEAQQAPMFAGAYVIFRGEEISTLEVRFELWLPEHFTAWKAFAAMLRAGAKKRPPRVYALTDLTVEDSEIKQVALASIGRQEKLAPGKWGYTVTFTEYRKPKPIGGPLAPKSDRDKKIEALNDENKALAVQLAAAKAAARANK